MNILERLNITADNFLYLSYNTYSNANAHSAIITIGDGDFISATEFSNLLKGILNCNKITPYIVNKLLIDRGFLIKNIAFDKKDLTSSKYLPVNEKGLHYKKIYFNKTPFYIWDYKILFNIFDINFQKELIKDSARNICNVMNKYINISFNIDEVFINLIELQLLLFKESNFYCEKGTYENISLQNFEFIKPLIPISL